MGTSKLYTKSPYVYTRNGYRRPGVITKRIKVNDNREDPAEKDRNNRKIVTDTIIKYVESGMDAEKAVFIVANNKKVRQAFNYLIEAGIDLETLFMEFYNREVGRRKLNNDITR